MRDETLGSTSLIRKQKRQKTETNDLAHFKREKFKLSFFNPHTSPVHPTFSKTPTSPMQPVTKDDIDSVLETLENLNIQSTASSEHRLQRKEFSARVDQLRTTIRLKNGNHQALYNRTQIPPKKEPIRPLTEAENIQVDNALKPGQAGPLSQFKTAEVEYKDIYKLGPGTWLNDEVINFHFELLADRASQNTFLPSIHCFNTFFCSTLREQGYTKVKRWTKRVDIFSKDLVFVPINKAYHWVLGVIDMQQKKISIYDSLYGKDHTTLTLLLEYLQQEHLDKKKEAYDTTDWEIVAPGDIPKQQNAYDCGVFACAFAERLSRRAPLDFSQNDMDLIRRKMILAILNKTIL